MTVKLGHDICDMTSAMTLDRIARPSQSRQISLVRSAMTGQQGLDSGDRCAADGAGQLGQYSRTGQADTDRWDRTGGTG
jgi:hypothetical protein